MTGKNDEGRQALNRLADALVDDLLHASDEDILAEFSENHGDPAHHAARMRALFERVAISANKSRLKAAQASVAARRFGGGHSAPLSINAADARAILRRVLADRTKDSKVTLAARKEDELSDADVLGIVSALIELGVLPPDAGKGGPK